MIARSVPAWALGIAAASFGGCTSKLEPRGQVVLYVDTDAPVPVARGEKTDAVRQPGLIDRARIEVYADGKPLAGATREFAVDEGVLRDRALSFGVLPSEPGDAALSVRVRLFRAERLRAGEPPAGITLDTTVKLPAVSAEGIVPLSVVLHADDFGKSVGPIDPDPGIYAAHAATWHGGAHVPCRNDHSETELCVPGGAFFMGDPLMRGRSAISDIVDERLVVMSPYIIDRTEVTVRAFRAAWPKLAENHVDPPLVSSADHRSSNGSLEEDWCTWKEEPDVSFEGVQFDQRPLNCVSWDTARAYCQAKGADLPTEAQLEYIASGLGQERAYAWGNDEPDCSVAIWGRGGRGAYSEGAFTCVPAGQVGWLALPGAGSRDRVEIVPLGGQGEVVDLGGSLSEWARDMWSQPSEPFWITTTVMVDPIADFVGKDTGFAGKDVRPIRGGNWALSPVSTRASSRGLRPHDTRRAIIGFRCVRPGGAP